MKILEILHQHSLVHHFTSPVHAPSRRVISKEKPESATLDPTTTRSPWPRHTGLMTRIWIPVA